MCQLLSWQQWRFCCHGDAHSSLIVRDQGLAWCQGGEKVRVTLFARLLRRCVVKHRCMDGSVCSHLCLCCVNVSAALWAGVGQAFPRVQHKSLFVWKGSNFILGIKQKATSEILYKKCNSFVLLRNVLKPMSVLIATVGGWPNDSSSRNENSVNMYSKPVWVTLC